MYFPVCQYVNINSEFTFLKARERAFKNVKLIMSGSF